MVISMKVSSKMMIFMDKAFTLVKMVNNMLENLLKDLERELENLFMLMEKAMKVNGEEAKCMEKVNLYG